jgi:hypothetical protein
VQNNSIFLGLVAKQLKIFGFVLIKKVRAIPTGEQNIAQ